MALLLAVPIPSAPLSALSIKTIDHTPQAYHCTIAKNDWTNGVLADADTQVTFTRIPNTSLVSVAFSGSNLTVPSNIERFGTMTCPPSPTFISGDKNELYYGTSSLGGEPNAVLLSGIGAVEFAKRGGWDHGKGSAKQLNFMYNL